MWQCCCSTLPCFAVIDFPTAINFATLSQPVSQWMSELHCNWHCSSLDQSSSIYFYFQLSSSSLRNSLTQWWCHCRENQGAISEKALDLICSKRAFRICLFEFEMLLVESVCVSFFFQRAASASSSAAAALWHFFFHFHFHFLLYFSLPSLWAIYHLIPLCWAVAAAAAAFAVASVQCFLFFFSVLAFFLSFFHNRIADFLCFSLAFSFASSVKLV